jgi:hypothetical protein
VNVYATTVFVFNVIDHAVRKLIKVLTATLTRSEDSYDPYCGVGPQIGRSVAANPQPISPCNLCHQYTGKCGLPVLSVTPPAIASRKIDTISDVFASGLRIFHIAVS